MHLLAGKAADIARDRVQSLAQGRASSPVARQSPEKSTGRGGGGGVSNSREAMNHTGVVGGEGGSPHGRGGRRRIGHGRGWVDGVAGVAQYRHDPGDRGLEKSRKDEAIVLERPEQAVTAELEAATGQTMLVARGGGGWIQFSERFARERLEGPGARSGSCSGGDAAAIKARQPAKRGIFRKQKVKSRAIPDRQCCD